MILLFGTRAVESMLLAVTLVCVRCGVRGRQRVMRRATKLTVFFVPLLTLSTSRYMVCEHCGLVTALTKDQVAHAEQWSAVDR